MWQTQKMTKIKHINSLTSAKIFAKIKQIQILTYTAALYWLSISTPYMYKTFLEFCLSYANVLMPLFLEKHRDLII